MKYRYIIYGKNKFGVIEKYFEGNDLEECLKYLNQLKTSTALDTVKFCYIDTDNMFKEKFNEY
jgi:hypothetical protein